MTRRASFVHRVVLIVVSAVGVAAAVCLPVARAETPSSAPAPASQPAAKPANPQLQRAWEQVRVANWPRAVDAFEAIAADSDDSEVAAEAVLALGHIWQHRRPGHDVTKAHQYYGRVVDSYGDSKAAPWARLAVARMIDTPEHEPKTDSERAAIRQKAQRAYQQILDNHPGHLAAHEAALRLAVTYLEQRGDADADARGSAVLTDHLGAYPDNYLAATMHTLVGEYHQRHRRPREAVKSFIASYEAGLPSMFHRAKTCYRIAQIAEFIFTDDVLAAHWYETLVATAIGDNRYGLAQIGLKRCRDRLAEAGTSREGPQ